MATNDNTPFCDICQHRDLNKSAEDYCPQCEEAHCVDCRDHHKISKLSKSHQTISIDKYNKLPSFFKQISHNCQEHACILEFYCKSHDSLCCKICSISDHKECKEIIFIEDFLTSSKGHPSVALDNIEKVLKDLEINISSAIKDRSRNLTELRDQKQVIAKQIKEKRQEIDILLDNLEKALQENASVIEKEYSKQIEDVIAKLNEEKKKVDEIQKDIESVKRFATNIQIFIGSKTFQEKVSTNELSVQLLYDNGSFENLKMVSTFNEKLNGLVNELKTFGNIKVENCEKHVSFSWKSNKSAQIFRSTPLEKSIENLRVRLVRKITIDYDGISGCAMSETGNLFFLPMYKNKLLSYSQTREFLSESCIEPKISNIGYDLSVVDSNTVAVSSGGNGYKIYFFDMESEKLRQVFDTGDYCYGFSHHNGSIMCCTFNKGIKIFDRLHQNLKNVRILPNAPRFVQDSYVTSNENNIFHSNCNDSTVICYDFSGQVQWKYTDSLLKRPHGITLDHKNNVYVAGSESNNIVVISKDGKQAKELVGSRDGISNPHALYFEKNKSILLVTNYNGVAFLYDVS
ncbi:putative leucine-rich repeat-containing protein DDB_G0290503 [Mytilus edulis]|uniref:putative leucine-rich repeat-containing protein DDB_G0290503 n=1 Tax=Mytilus edulis TaxID=6550 RepID=UPI0039EE82C5